MATGDITKAFKLDSLTTNGVSVLTTTFTQVNGKLVQTEKLRKAYLNSEKGRNELTKELEEPYYLAAVLAVWGDAPTVALPKTSSDGRTN
jgi:hypothetical protein